MESAPAFSGCIPEVGSEILSVLLTLPLKDSKGQEWAAIRSPGNQCPGRGRRSEACSTWTSVDSGDRSRRRPVLPGGRASGPRWHSALVKAPHRRSFCDPSEMQSGDSGSGASVQNAKSGKSLRIPGPPSFHLPDGGTRPER